MEPASRPIHYQQADREGLIRNGRQSYAEVNRYFGGHQAHREWFQGHLQLPKTSPRNFLYEKAFSDARQPLHAQTHRYHFQQRG